MKEEDSEKEDETIKEGDDIILYLDSKRKYLVKIIPHQTVHTHRGYIKLDEVIGKRYGAKIKSHMGKEFHILRPRIRDYILKSRRATQIIYPKDIALIINFAGIGPGSKVIEAGTGSGALTIALAYHVQPNGKIYSYEIKEENIEVAKRNVGRAGLLDYVQFKNRDVNEGFDEKNMDAVILDLATPWLIIDKAYEALKDAGILVSYSPTIEQIIKTAETLRANHFTDIECIECIIRRYKVKREETRPETRMIGHTGYILFATKTIRDEKDEE